ncbi:DUF1752-domain-containing protein [Venturia nashicola]|uniref:DUF1752-domain-containing protein n=1 Tax=Venturia nashicola TaxID=86259 RepID=A0A4Z1PC32_9PEZI|nr:DUF1752-domain-containing protein [Venturia nashicola]
MSYATSYLSSSPFGTRKNDPKFLIASSSRERERDLDGSGEEVDVNNYEAILSDEEEDKSDSEGFGFTSIDFKANLAPKESALTIQLKGSSLKQPRPKRDCYPPYQTSQPHPQLSGRTLRMNKSLPSSAQKLYPNLAQARLAPLGSSPQTLPQTLPQNLVQGLTPASRAHSIIMITSNVHPPALSPRTTRRSMLSTELTESLRKHLLWNRQVCRSTTVLKRRHTVRDITKLDDFLSESQPALLSNVNLSATDPNLENFFLGLGREKADGKSPLGQENYYVIKESNVQPD